MKKIVIKSENKSAIFMISNLCRTHGLEFTQSGNSLLIMSDDIKFDVIKYMCNRFPEVSVEEI